MNVKYDSVADALYIELRVLEPGTAENRPVTDDVTLNFGPDGRIAGVEILEASEVLGKQIEGFAIEGYPSLKAGSA